jgi:hypothetical protein
MDKHCSVCKQRLEEATHKENLFKCGCGYWKIGVNENCVFEDAGSPRPTLRFLISK